MSDEEKIAILKRQLGHDRQPSPQSQLTDAEKRMCFLTGVSEATFLAQRSVKAAAHTTQPRAAALMVPSLPYASRAVMAQLADNPNGSDDDDDLPSMSIDELCDRANEHLAAREDPDEGNPDGRLAKASACLMEALNRRTAPEADGGDGFLQEKHSRRMLRFSGPLN